MTDHPDIVERLRDKSGKWINGLYDEEAAAEITRLRAEAEALRKAAVNAHALMESNRVFLLSREKVKYPEGIDLWDETADALRAAIAATKEQQA